MITKLSKRATLGGEAGFMGGWEWGVSTLGIVQDCMLISCLLNICLHCQNVVLLNMIGCVKAVRHSSWYLYDAV